MTTSPPRPNRAPAPTWLVTIVLAGLAMIGPFTIDTIFPGFASMGEQFEVDSATMQQVTTAYLIPFAVMSIFHGPISDAVGRKPVMLVGLAGFVLAGIGCALAPSLGWLLAARAGQGFFAGAATVVSRAVVRDLYEGAEAQRLMSQIMVIFSIAPAIAPVVGGWLLAVGPWPLIFWFVAGYGVAVAVLMTFVLPETLPVEDRQPLRVGTVLAGIWEVGRSWPFLRLAIGMGMSFGAYIFYVMAAPIIVVDLMGLGEQDFWKLFVPLIGGMATGSFLSGRLAGRIDSLRLVDYATAFLALASAINVALAVLAPTLPWSVVGPTLLGAGIGVAFPIIQLALLDQFPHHRGAAASLSAFVILMGNVVLAGVVAPLMTGSLLTTALASATMTVVGIVFWVWHRRAAPRPA